MIRLNWFGCAVIMLGLALSCATPVDAGGKKSDSKVKAAVQASKIEADGKQRIAITLTVEKGWYIYANPVGSEDYEGNKTRVSFTAKGKLAATVKFPKGTTKTEVIGKETVKYDIYKDRVVIQAEVRRPPSDAGPLQIKVDVNACKIGKKGNTVECLLPGTISLSVP
ncbi:MAG: hypothetical protein HYX68_12365 [Planctomycetes bacterium]|jgi:DsbC/DsbD-like thiol-disulfide interchange protein|nr:hypothetical protein [Planctomycetota bacterium]